MTIPVTTVPLRGLGPRGGGLRRDTAVFRNGVLNLLSGGNWRGSRKRFNQSINQPLWSSSLSSSSSSSSSSASSSVASWAQVSEPLFQYEYQLRKQNGCATSECRLFPAGAYLSNEGGAACASCSADVLGCPLGLPQRWQPERGDPAPDACMASRARPRSVKDTLEPLRLSSSAQPSHYHVHSGCVFGSFDVGPSDH